MSRNLTVHYIGISLRVPEMRLKRLYKYVFYPDDAHQIYQSCILD